MRPSFAACSACSARRCMSRSDSCIALGSNGMMLLLRCASCSSACMCRSIAWRSSSSFFASSWRCRVVRLLLRLVHRIARGLAGFLQRPSGLFGLALLHVQRQLPHQVLRLGHRAVGVVADQVSSTSPLRVEECADVAGEQPRGAASAHRAPPARHRGHRDARSGFCARRSADWATGLWNGRSASSKVASALVPVCPVASRATSRPTTGKPAHGWAVRSGWLRPCAAFGEPPGSGIVTINGGASRPVAQTELRLQTGNAIIVRDLPRQPGLLTDGGRPGVVAPCGGRRLVGDHGQHPGGQRAVRPASRSTRPPRVRSHSAWKLVLIQRGEWHRYGRSATGSVRRCRRRRSPSDASRREPKRCRPRPSGRSARSGCRRAA